MAEAILKKIRLKIFIVHLVALSSNMSFKCTNLYQFWHRNISKIGAPEHLIFQDELTFNIFC